MKLRLKEIRQIKGLKASEVAEKLSITKNSLSEWESGKRIPPCERIIQLADFYNVSVDYLLGRDERFENNTESLKPVSKSVLSIHHGRPVWIDGIGWALVNAAEGVLVYPDGSKHSPSEVPKAYSQPPQYGQSVLPDTDPVEVADLTKHDSVWVEPISVYGAERTSLRGWYDVKDEFVENKRGSRFFFDSYGATWLAFANKA